MTTAERIVAPLRERISANVMTLMPSRRLYKDMELATLLGWTTAKTSRCLHKGAWQLDDLDHVARKLGVNVADLTKDPSDYLPKRDLSLTQEYVTDKSGCGKVRNRSSPKQGPRSANLIRRAGDAQGIKPGF
jgi:hypothetical protein